MLGRFLVQHAVCQIYIFFSFNVLIILSYQLYLVQYSLLFNFADWQCVAQIISMYGLVANKQFNWL